MRYIITVEDDSIKNIKEIAINLENIDFKIVSTLNILGVIIVENHEKPEEALTINGVKAIEIERIISIT